MYMMMAMSDSQEQGLLLGVDALTMDYTRAYICITEAGAKAVADVFLSRNPECDEVRVIKVHTVAAVTRESTR